MSGTTMLRPRDAGENHVLALRLFRAQRKKQNVGLHTGWAGRKAVRLPEGVREGCLEEELGKKWRSSWRKDNQEGRQLFVDRH